MADPVLSAHFKQRNPSAIRLAQIEFARRTDGVIPINAAIGNVSLPMHPAMQNRLRNLGEAGSPFMDGVVKYSATVGIEETRAAFMNVIASSGGRTDGLHALVTDGGSQSMELIIVGTCGPAGTLERPLLLLDAAYVNYRSFAERCGRATVSIRRTLQNDGTFTLPDLSEIDSVIAKTRPGAILVIPYDNPTGQFMSMRMMAEIARIAVKHNLWMISDEAYRELYYVDGAASSIWALSDDLVPGIEGRRIGIDTASKVWNACGLRIGALITDNEEFHRRAVAEYTANLCANTIGQHIFGALAHESHGDLRRWYDAQRTYYREMMSRVALELTAALPGIIISRPDAAIYSVMDVRDIVPASFSAHDFVMHSAQRGKVAVDGREYTALVSPMTEFYAPATGLAADPGRTQMRIAYVDTPEKMALFPRVITELIKERGHSDSLTV